MSPPPGFPPGFLAELRQRTPLAALVAGRVKLTKAGRLWKGLCPFHAEKTPSFTVYPNGFHCFGCGATGDAIGFVMQSEGASFPEAVQRLAADAGMPVPGANTAAPLDPAEAARRAREAERRQAEREAQREAEAAAVLAQRILAAQKFWSECIPFAGTPGERNYREARQIPEPAGGWWPALRYHVATRAIVCALTTPDGTVQAVHRTLLTASGANKRRDGKKLKLGMGSRDGAATMLPGVTGSPILLHGEGAETVATCASISGHDAIAYHGKLVFARRDGTLVLKARMVPGRVNVLLCDDDGPVARIQAAAIEQWRDEGYSVALAPARAVLQGGGYDWNDLVREAGAGAVRDRLQSVLPRDPEPPVFPSCAPPRALPTATMAEVHAGIARDAAAFFTHEPIHPLIGRQTREPLNGRTLQPRAIPHSKRRPPVILRSDEPGASKTTTFAHFGGDTARVRKLHGMPWRIVHLVPEHTTLPPQLLEQYQRAGLTVAHLRGRGDPRNRKPTDLCGDLDAVADARAIGASPSQAACGSLDGPHCALFATCRYQLQMAELAAADVIVAAATFMFEPLPHAALTNIWAVLIEESFADGGDHHTRTPLDTFRQVALDRAPVLTENGTRDDAATAELARLHERLVELCDRASDGYLPSADFAAADVVRARHLNGRRKIDAGILPGMDKEHRRELVRAAAINGQVFAINAAWRALRGRNQGDLPGIAGRNAGRFELESADTRHGTQRYILTHGQRRIAPWLKRRPIAILAGSMSLADVRRFFPRAIEQTTQQAVAPHATTELFLGAWGTRALVPNERKREALHDYLTMRGAGRGHKGIIAPLACVDTFNNMPDSTVRHHGANAGSNAMVTAGLVASIGGPFARPADIARTAAARTGEPVPHARAVRSSEPLLLTDGTAIEIPTLGYEHPAAQAVHRSIYHAGINQAHMRGRPQLRTELSQVLTLIFANIAPDRPVDRVHYWRDIPHRLVHMVAHKRVTFNAAQMVRLYEAKFPTLKAAEHARARWGTDYRATLRNLIGEDPCSWHEITYQPRGQGFKVQSEFCRADALAATLADIRHASDPVDEPAVSTFKDGRASDDAPASFNVLPKQPGESSAPVATIPAAWIPQIIRGPEHPPDG